MTAAGVEVKKSEVLMPNGTLREVGEFDIELHLHSDVFANITLKVVAA